MVRFAGASTISRPITDYRRSANIPCLWHKGAIRHAQLMLISRNSHVPYAELPSEARMLFSIFAQAAAASYVARPLKHSELTPLLETIWNRNRLCLSDVANPYRMTALLETELKCVCATGGAQ